MPPCHGGGRGFEPRPLRHLLNLRLRFLILFFLFFWVIKLNFKIISSKITLYDLLLILNLASLAQLVEHITLNDGVVGSRPTRGTIFWPIRLAVRTPASHVGNTSSSLVWVTIFLLNLTQILKNLLLVQWIWLKVFKISFYFIKGKFVLKTTRVPI